MSKVLYPFQEHAVQFHVEHPYAICGLEQGLGKTVVALEVAKRLQLSPVVFGPRFLMENWHREALAHGVKINYIPYTQLNKVLINHLAKYDLWIAEEAHYLKNPKAQRTHDFYRMLQQRRPKRLMMLTGTPIKNRAYDLWTLLGFCDLSPTPNPGANKLIGEFTKYYAFSRYFCHAEKITIGNRRFEKFGQLREDKIQEFKALLRGKIVRYRAVDVLKDLPSLVRKEVYSPLRPDPAGEKELSDAFDSYIAGRKFDVTAKAKSALLKAHHTAQYVDDLIEDGAEAIVVFTDHLESANYLHKRLKAALVTGATPPERRQIEVDDFQAGKTPIIVATIGSLSIGVTLTRSRNVVFNDLSWVPADNMQAEKRIHRIGQKGGCFSHFIISSPTDLHIQKTLISKMETITEVLG